MQITKRILLATFTLTLGVLIACGCQNSTSEDPSSEEGVGTSSILLSDRNFTPDSFVQAGWKKSKQYDTETVPQATDIWYGFFNAKDIEVRFYESHEIAKTAGFENAAEAIDQSFREGGQYGASNRGAGSSAVTKYKAFVVAGNTVMLCEQSVDSCIALADVLGN